MTELIEKIKQHQGNNNKRICNELIDAINDYNINSEEELLNYENKFFIETDLNKRIDMKYKEYLADTSRFEFLDNDDFLNLDEYEKLLNESNDSLEKCKYLILIYDYINFMLYFPYEAYLLIIKDNLKGKYDDSVRDFDDE